MKVRILGSVHIHGRHETVHPSSAGVRALLGLLAWRPNELVSDVCAVEEVWGQELPRFPRDALYTCASRLRHAFRAVGGDPAGIVRERGAYRLEIDPQDIDLHRFRRLIGQARILIREGGDDAALALFEEAEHLWTGAPLSDVASPWADRIGVVLQQEWRSAQLGRVEASLRRGRHVEVLPLLQQLAADHPLDEAIASMLMLALHRSGRQGDALACFAGIRRRLVTEIGDEPGGELSRLHDRVLCRDPALGVGSLGSV